jgi:hypothetical protein
VIKRTTIVLALGAILALLVAMQIAFASHGPNGSSGLFVLPGSDFEIDTDANLKVDHASPSIDWLTGSNVTDPFREDVDWKFDTASGSLDESFTQGTKEDTADPVVENGSIPPNKSDLKAFGIHEEEDEFLNLFWARVQDPSGTTNMDFELNQKFCNPSATPTNCAPTSKQTPVRTGDGAGPLQDDILITYDLSRGGTVATISIRKWTGSQWGPATLLSQQTEAVGTINTSAITASPIQTTQSPNGSLSPRTFGEASVSFDALFGEDQCGTFGSAYLKSRSSDSFTAALKDFVPPLKAEISNCPAAITTDASNNGTQTDPAATLPNGQIQDSATLTVQDGTDGNIVFRLYGPFTTAPDGPEDCIATGANENLIEGAGSTRTVTDHTAASNPYTSTAYTPTAAGIYQWTAQFNSTTAGVDSTAEFGCGVALEQSKVNPAAPTLTTDATDSATLPNGTLSDTATLSGATSNATGTITFKAYGPFTNADPTTDACTAANLVYTSSARPIGSPNASGNYVVSSDDNSTPSDDFKPTAAGRYQWVATYSGDNNNTGLSTNCNDPNEQSVVNTAQSTISTTQSWVPQDSATVSQGGGTVTFTLLKNVNEADCLANTYNTGDPGVIYKSGALSLPGSAPFTVSTNNQTAVTSSAATGDTYRWKVEYSGTSAFNAVTTCKELTTITIDNGTQVTN